MSTIPSPRAGSADLERLYAELEGFDELPTPPWVLQEIWRVLGSERSSASSLSEVVEKDTALTAKLLKLANSAYFGLSRPVGEVRAACVVLGFEMVRALAVGVSSLDALSTGAAQAIDLRAFWRHSVGTGTAAQAIARRARIPGAGTAFCAGVLHDLGKLVLVTFSPERYAAIARLDDALSISDREVREFGGDHQSVGAWIAERWRFPVEIRGAIRLHHKPWADDTNRWGALLHVADWMARRNGCPSVPEASPDPPEAPDPRASEILAISAEDLHEVGERFAAELEKVETFVDTARG